MLRKFEAFFTRLSLAQRFSLVGLAVLVLGTVGIGSWVSRQIEQGVINRTGATTALFVNSLVAPHLEALSAAGTLTEADRAGLSQLLRDTDLGQTIVAFKVWDLTGLVLYSTDASTIGQRFPLQAGLLRATLGAVSSEISSLEEPENAAQRAIQPRLLETYSPVRLVGTNRIVAVAEFYQTVEALEQEMAAARTRSWLVVGGAMLAIYSALLLFVLQVSRTLELQRTALHAQVSQLTGLLGQVRELDERVRRAAGRTTAVNERVLRRISAELHDGPAQDLALALLRMDHVLATAEACAQNNCNRSDGDDLQVVQRALDHSLKEIRAIATGLGVPELDRLSPLEIVRRVAHAHERKTATKVDLDLTKLPEEAALPVKITLYRLVQEALSNAFRHAQGAGQRVQVRALAGQLDVEVSDTGAGFVRADATGAEEHLGLVGMRERVESLGGRFRIESRLGRGTRVIAQLPLQVETAMSEP